MAAVEWVEQYRHVSGCKALGRNNDRDRCGMKRPVVTEPAKLIKDAYWELAPPTTYWRLRKGTYGMLAFVRPVAEVWATGIIGEDNNPILPTREDAMHWVETYILVTT